MLDAVNPLRGVVFAAIGIVGCFWVFEDILLVSLQHSQYIDAYIARPTYRFDEPCSEAL